MAWATSSGDDLLALTTINGALVEGSRLQPPIDKMLGQRMAVALDEDSERSASNEEEEAEVVVEVEEGELVAAAGVAAGLASDGGAAAAPARLDKEIELDESSRRRVPRRGRARQGQVAGAGRPCSCTCSGHRRCRRFSRPRCRRFSRPRAGTTWCRMHTARNRVGPCAGMVTSCSGAARARGRDVSISHLPTNTQFPPFPPFPLLHARVTNKARYVRASLHTGTVLYSTLFASVPCTVPEY